MVTQNSVENQFLESKKYLILWGADQQLFTLFCQNNDGQKRTAITVSCPAEQDLLQLGRTTAQSG